MGSVEQLCEPAVTAPKQKPEHTGSGGTSNRIEIKYLSKSTTELEIRELTANFGSLQKCEIATVPNTNESTAILTFETVEQAKRSRDYLDKYEFSGKILKADYVLSGIRRGGAATKRAERSHSHTSAGAVHSITYPLRILVPSEYVGAIIGKKGQSIKTITTKCKARVDVHGKDNSGRIEKVISIYGQPENCSKACKEIMQVIQQESANGAKSEMLLKMLTNDRYCGRLIGKEGRMIKKLREETGTRIVLTNCFMTASAQDMVDLYPDRVIAIRGSLDNMVLAEGAISSKLAECMEQDIKAQKYFSAVYARSSGSHLCSLGGGVGSGLIGAVGRPAGGLVGGGTGGAPGLRPSLVEICQIYVPNSAVGTIIGSGGVNIKQIMRDSGAFITVEHKSDAAAMTPATERVCTIRGTPDECWRASYYVFEKMKLEGFSGNDDVRLKTIIRVPRSTVGRIIGKGGKNVREIQRLTGGIIKLPQDKPHLLPGTGTVNGGGGGGNVEDWVPVEVHGNFMSTQSAYSRIRALVNLTLHRGGGGEGGGGLYSSISCSSGLISSHAMVRPYAVQGYVSTPLLRIIDQK